MPARQRPPAENELRVLVVDDDDNIADVLSMALRYEDFAVEKAGSGRDALKRDEDFRPHIMILDVPRMPGGGPGSGVPKNASSFAFSPLSFGRAAFPAATASVAPEPEKT